MKKRKSSDIRMKILWTVRETPATYSILERKVNTGFRSIKQNCEDLEMHGEVMIKESKRHPKNGRPYKTIHITDRGMELLEKSQKKKQ